MVISMISEKTKIPTMFNFIIRDPNDLWLGLCRFRDPVNCHWTSQHCL